MIDQYTIGLVIPCHNEAEGLQQLLSHRPAEIDTVIVVDNNSTDETATVARSFKAEVVFQPQPGYGAAYQAGLAHIQTDIVVTLDGDGQYPITEVPQFVRYLLGHQLDFVSANRFPLQQESMPFVRQIGNVLLTGAAWWLFGMHIQDTQSGMWAFRRSVLEHVHLQQTGMAFSEELKIKVIWAGLKFGETHIPYLPRTGTSKLLPLQDGWKNLVYLWRLRVALWSKKPDLV